jgi:choline dehydrogenase
MTEDQYAHAVSRFIAEGTGPFATNFLEAGMFLRLDPVSQHPDVQVHFGSDFGPDLLDGSYSDRHGFDFSPNVARPKSRGYIKLRTPNPLDKPEINPRYLSEPDDLELTIKALEKCREVISAEAFRELGAKEVYPGEFCSREQLERYVRRTANTVWHPAGTCRMGTDNDAVVDPQLRVQGIESLRIADASIMPTLISGNTNAPCIMIGEKAAELVLRS